MISSSFYLPKIQFCFLNTEICVCSQLQKILSFISLNRSFPSLAQFSFKIPNSVSKYFMASIFNYIFHCKFYFLFPSKMFVLFIICASFSYFLYCNCSPSLCLISLCITFNYKFIFSGLFLWNFHLAWNKSSLFGRHIPSLTAYVYHLISCCLFCPFLCFIWASQVTQLVKNPPAIESRRHKRCEFDPWIRKMPWRRK